MHSWYLADKLVGPQVVHLQAPLVVGIAVEWLRVAVFVFAPVADKLADS